MSTILFHFISLTNEMKSFLFTNFLNEMTSLTYTDETSHEEFFLFIESIKRDPKTRPVYECRDERLKTKAEGIYTPHMHCVSRETSTRGCLL
jgi:hypothetical protein